MDESGISFSNFTDVEQHFLVKCLNDYVKHINFYFYLLYASTCFDLFTRHHQAFLHYESKMLYTRLGSQHVYINKIYDSVTSVMQVEVMYVYITVCS